MAVSWCGRTAFGTLRDVLIRLHRKKTPVWMQRPPTPSSAKASACARPRRWGQVELRRVEFVGPQVGDELAEDGALAVLVSLIAVLMYVAMRFEWRFRSRCRGRPRARRAVHRRPVCAVADGVQPAGTGGRPRGHRLLASTTPSSSSTACVNFRKMRKGSPWAEIINVSINQTMAHDHDLGHDVGGVAGAVLPSGREKRAWFLAGVDRRCGDRDLLDHLRGVLPSHSVSVSARPI